MLALLRHHGAFAGRTADSRVGCVPVPSPSQLGNWYTWLVLPLFFVTAVFWITRLNKVRSTTGDGRRHTEHTALSGAPCVPLPTWVPASLRCKLLSYTVSTGAMPARTMLMPALAVCLVDQPGFQHVPNSTSDQQYEVKPPLPPSLQGLRMFPAMIIVPVMQIAWTLFSIVSGMLYFQEYLGFTVLKSIMFPIGVLVRPHLSPPNVLPY